jgi:hypothetical protein
VSVVLSWSAFLGGRDICVRLSAAICGHWRALSHGHSNVGSHRQLTFVRGSCQSRRRPIWPFAVEGSRQLTTSA